MPLKLIKGSCREAASLSLSRAFDTRLPAFDSSALDAAAVHCTSPQSTTHSTEKREVRYPWHPWCGQIVGVDERITKGGRTFLRCRSEGATNGRALEIPHWMFERDCDGIGMAEKPSVDCATLWNLSALLRDVSLFGHRQEKAQHLQPRGGADAKNTGPATSCSAGIVSIGDSERFLGHIASRNPAEGETTNSTPAAPAAGDKVSAKAKRGGRP